MILLQDIQNAKHIVIKFDVEYLTSACALYTYALQLHKKVSLLCTKTDIDNRFSFLPWFEKIKHSGYSSADFILELSTSALELYELFEKNSIKLNQKMATALYAGLLVETDGFKNSNVNGMIFAVAKQLIDAKADYKACTRYILNTKSLAYLRLKSLMLKSILLKENATLVMMSVSDNDFKASGAKLDDAYDILQEGLTLLHVEEALLIKEENKTILKRIKKEI